MAHSADPPAPATTPNLRAAPEPPATEAPETWPPATEHPGNPNAAISDAVGRIFRDYLGRGPTKTRTSIRDDVVVVLLEDTLTKAEKTLAAEGETEAILRMRHAFQGTMRPALSDVVTRLTGRRVIAFMSDNHFDPDYAIEAFVLEPITDNGHPSRVERA